MGSASCGDRRVGSTPPDVAGTLSLTENATLEIPQGAILRADSDAPLVWSATPTATIHLITSDDNPDTQRIALGNLHPDVTLDLQSVQSASDVSGVSCDSDLSRTIDCTDTTHEACDVGRLESSEVAPTRKQLVVDPEPCHRLEYRLSPPSSALEPRQFAAIGRTETSSELDAILERIERRHAPDFVWLLGDHLDRGEGEALRPLAQRLRRRSVPVVMTPGERELVDGALSDFQGSFGGASLTWQFGDRSFVTFPSPRQSLGREGVEALRNRLRDDVEGVPIVATHTPPFDPIEGRSAGFDSTVEGGRITSLLTRRSVPLLIAGHLSTREHERMGDTDLVISSSAEEQQYTLFERRDGRWEWQRR